MELGGAEGGLECDLVVYGLVSWVMLNKSNVYKDTSKEDIDSELWREVWRTTYLGEDDDLALDVFECLSCVHSALLVNEIQGRGKEFGLRILEA